MLGDYLAEHLFEPIGMKDTAFNLTQDRRARLAGMHARFTNSQRMREIAVMISSTMPSAKYSCSGSSEQHLYVKEMLNILSGVMFFEPI